MISLKDNKILRYAGSCLLWAAGYALVYTAACCLSEWLFHTVAPVEWIVVTLVVLAGIASRIYCGWWSIAMFILAATYSCQILSSGAAWWIATGIGYTAWAVAEVFEWRLLERRKVGSR